MLTTPITRFTAHRPWPLPSGPWIMEQKWHDLLFAHWRVSFEELRAVVPAPFEIDLYDGQAWIGVIPFHMSGVRPRGIPPIPGLSAFPRLNVRTYVKVGDKPGILFFSLDAASRLAVWGARISFHLPYFYAHMTVEKRPDGWVRYLSRRNSSGGQTAAQFIGEYRPLGPVYQATPGSLDHWLAERYCLYTLVAEGNVLRAEIHHPPWPLQKAEAHLELNTMAKAAGLFLHGDPLLHFAAFQDVVVWPPS